MIADCHSHNLEATDAIINVGPDFNAFADGRFYSIGVHPWDSAGATDLQLQQLSRLARLPQVVAIGEAGIDKLRGASRERQIELLRAQALLAEEVAKPLIIHCVGAWEDILRLHRELSPGQPWIIHGFRGKPELARQLLAAGLYLSLGEHFNPETAKIVPLDRLLVETDESSLPINHIAAQISPDALNASAQNINRIFPLKNDKKPAL